MRIKKALAIGFVAALLMTCLQAGSASLTQNATENTNQSYLTATEANFTLHVNEALKPEQDTTMLTGRLLRLVRVFGAQGLLLLVLACIAALILAFTALPSVQHRFQISILAYSLGGTSPPRFARIAS